jgi:hypothetical protein
MRFDDKGNIVLADVPNANVARIASGQKSGNKRHDVRSGKFGAGGASRQRKPDPPNTTDSAGYHRMLDAVRAAAREFDDPSQADIADFIKARATNPDQVDIAQFFQMVVDQRRADLVDLLDHQLRSNGPLASGRRKVRLAAPRGYMKRLLGSMKPEDLSFVMHRLEALGHPSAKVEEFFKGRVKDDTHATAVEQKKAIAAADWQADPPEDELLLADESFGDAFSVETLTDLLRQLPQPIINVEVKLPDSGGTIESS